jgi:hypothetical protein
MVASIAEEIGDVRVDIMVTTLMMKNRSRQQREALHCCCCFCPTYIFPFLAPTKIKSPKTGTIPDEPTTKKIEKERRPCHVKNEN